MVIVGLLTAIAFFSALTAIVLNQKERVKSFILFKGITTLIIIIIAIFSYGSMPGSYSAVLLVSLVFALMGDIFLAFKNYFRQGLTAFLFAQTGFIIAFVSVAGFHLHIMPLLILLVYAGIFYSLLYNHLHLLKVPVALYTIVMVVMVWQAAGLAISIGQIYHYMVLLGAILFLISDSVLSWYFFRYNRKWLNIIILSSYWLAIWLFALAGFSIA
jgi:uncharacterized membrane protein YhhN